MPIDESLLEPVGIDESLLEPVATPTGPPLQPGRRPSLTFQPSLGVPPVTVPIPEWLDSARRFIIGPTAEEAAALEQRVLPRVSPVEKHGALGLLNKPTVTVPEWPRLQGDIPISALPSAAFGATWNALVKPAVEGFSSPGGIASMGLLARARALAQLGQLGKARQIAAPGAAVFGAPMVANVPSAARAAGTATVEGDTQEQMEAGLGAAATVVMPGTLAGAVLRPGAPPRIDPPDLPVPRGTSPVGGLVQAGRTGREPIPRATRETRRATAEVPGTDAEVYETATQAIRNANARTIADIQRLFPKANLSREQARAFRNAAFPEEAQGPLPGGQQPPQPPEPPAPAAAPVEPPPKGPAPAAPTAVQAAPDVVPPVVVPPEVPKAPVAPKAAAPAAPPAPVTPELIITALDLSESDLTLPKIRALPMNNPVLWARLQKYFGVRTVPEMQAKVKARFDDMRAAGGERAPEPIAPTSTETPPPQPPPVVPTAPPAVAPEGASVPKSGAAVAKPVQGYKVGDTVVIEEKVGRTKVQKEVQIAKIRRQGRSGFTVVFSDDMVTLGDTVEEAIQKRQPKPKPAPSAAPKRAKPVSDRPPDLIDLLEEKGIKIRSKAGMQPGEEGYYGDLYDRLAKSGARRLFSKTGQSWDDALDSLRRDGDLPDNFDVDAFQDALWKANDGRKGWRSGKTAEQKQLANMVAEQEEFEAAAYKPGEGKQGINVNELIEGDELEIGGVKFKVKELIWDPESLELAYVVLEDGRKFGVKTVGPDAVIYADEGTHKTAGPSTEFLPPEEEAASPVALGKIPEWVDESLRTKLESADAQGAPYKVDVHEEWAQLTSKQRQELALDGWSTSVDRKNRVQIGLNTDVGPNRLRKQVMEKRGEEPFVLEGVGRDQVRAEEAAQAKAQAEAKAKENLAAQAAAPLVGDSTDVGQGKLFSADEDLFSGPSAEQSLGPGAASRLEFDRGAKERAAQAAAGERPPGNSPPVVTPPPLPPNPPPLPDIRNTKNPYDIVSPVNSPQFTFWFGKLGETAKRAWERLALGALEIRESIGRDVNQYVDQALASLPRGMRRDGGKAFFDVLDGKTMDEIRTEYEGRPNGERIIAVAESVKTRLEQIRTTIRDTKRDTYFGALMGMDKATLRELFADQIDSSIDTARHTKEELSNALATAEFPDNWGISDGSYMPHLFLGDQKATVMMPGDEKPRFVLRGHSVMEVKAKIRDLVRKNPELAKGDWEVARDTVVPADIVRLGDGRFWKLITDMAEQGGMSKTEVKNAIRGNIGRQASKQKWWGSLQRRFGYGNYERNFRVAMSNYLVGFHRWRVLSELNRNVTPMIESVRREGRTNAADGLKNILDYMWGQPSASTKFVDSVLEQIPGVRQMVKPLALERWSRNARAFTSNLMLLTPRYALVNRLQPLQGLYPLLGERIMTKAKLLQHSAEGRRLLDEAGVRFDPGQYGEHSFVVPSVVQQIRERWSGERTNQEIAYLAMYLHARETGLSHQAAIPYSKLRGQLLTQFTPIAADIPPVMRGPFTGLLFQFKRFPIKQAELLYHMGRSGNVMGLSRWFAGMALAGGGAVFMRQFMIPGEVRKRVKDELDERFGEPMANALMYGAPGLLGVDLSTSLTLGDEPWGENIYEKAGRAVVGPFASSTIETAKALTTEEREPMTGREKLEVLLRRYPSLRPLVELSQMERGDVDIQSPDGEAKYRRTIGEALRGLGSFRSTEEANARIATDAIVAITKEADTLKNRFYVAYKRGDTTEAVANLQQFNARWPERPITAKELVAYLMRREKGSNSTDLERLVGQRYRSLLPPSRQSP